MKARDVAKKDPTPQWTRIKRPYTDEQGPKLGQILLNVQFLGHDPPERVLAERKGTQTYKFYYQIFSGFELANSLQSKDLDTRVAILIGNWQSGKGVND